MGTGPEAPLTRCVQIFLPNGGPLQGDAQGSRAWDKGSFPQSTGPCPSAPGPRLHPHLVVHRDAVGPADADVNQHHALGAVQPRPLNTWVLAPLSPEQVPVGRRGTWAQSPAHGGEGPVRVGCGLARLPGSSPLLRMDSDGPGLVQALGDDHVAEGAIEPGDLDDVKALVRPVDVA